MFDLRHTLELIDDGALDEAVTALEHAIAQMPAYTPAYVLLAETYETQGRWSKALATWQQARFFAPNSPAIETGLLRALEHQDVVPEDEDEADAPAVEPDEPAERMADGLTDAPDADAPPSSLPEDDAAAAPGGVTLPSLENLESQQEPDIETPDAEPLNAETSPTGDESLSAPYPSEGEPEEEDSETGMSDDAGNDTLSQNTPPDEPLSQDEPSEENVEAPPTSLDAPDAPPKPSAQPRPSPLDELASRLSDDPDQPLPDDLQDLDRLIDELEGARIDPQPDVENAPAPNLDNDVDDMVSETLARIYIAQKQYAEAARVYVRLAHQDPDRADEYRERAAELRERARDADQ